VVNGGNALPLDYQGEQFIPMQLLRVLLDARKIWDGGIGVYIRNLIAGLVENPAISLSILVPKRIVQDPKFAKYSWLDCVEVIEEDTKPYSCDELFHLGRKVTKNRFDLFHTPHYVLPFGIKVPTVVTIHDLIHVRYPEKFYYPFLSTPLILSAMKRAARILTVSQATYDDLKRLYPVSKVISKIRVVPNAIEPCFLKKCDNSAENLNSRFKITSPFFLAVFSNLKPHKGIKDLLYAFLAVKKRLQKQEMSLVKDFKLVLVGQGMEALPNMDILLEQLDEVRDVFILGRVSDEDLLNLYASASALVVSSLAEGFGLPVIEAQSQGCPVISRPVPCVKELLTEHDIVCTDFSNEALENALITFLERYSCGEYEDPFVDTIEKVKRFDRNELAKVVSKVYEEAFLHGC